MIKIKCDMCNKELDKQGGLLWSPPVGGKCDKYHLCIDCYCIVVTFICWFKVGDKRARNLIHTNRK